MKTDEILLTFIVGSLLVNFVESVQNCCAPNGGFSEKEEICSDGKNITLSCGKWFILDEFVDLKNRFKVINNGEGISLVYFNSVVHKPNFCLDTLTSTWTNENRPIAIVCSNMVEWPAENVEIKRRTGLSNLSIVSQFVNALSALALTLCAFIYGVLPPLRDTRGKCYFHFTLNAALGHVAFMYHMFFEMNIHVPILCVANLYVLIFLMFSCFSWTSVLSFHTWRQTKNTRITDESATTITKYICFGYGIPAILLFGFICIHLSVFSSMLEVNCRIIDNSILCSFSLISVLLSLLANLFFFIDCQRLLWNAHNLQQTTAIKRNLRKIKYRCLINTKLFFIMGIPWLAAIIIIFCNFSFSPRNPWYNLLAFILLLIVSEGIFIFLILVVSRKRVLKAIANKWFSNSNLVPNKWKTMNDSEAEQETENEENLNNEVLSDFNNANNENEISEGDNNVNVENEFRTDLIRSV